MNVGFDIHKDSVFVIKQVLHRLKKRGLFLNKRGKNIKTCYKTSFFIWIICYFHKSTYLCTVFFIVLDLRLTKVGARRCSFFYIYTYRIYRKIETINSNN